MNINKTDLINALAEKKSYKKYAIKNAIDDIFEEIAEALVRGDKVSIRGSGHLSQRCSNLIQPFTLELENALWWKAIRMSFSVQATS